VTARVPVIALSSGEPAGVGPELCARLAATRAPQDAAALAGRWLRRWLDEGLLVGLR